MQKDIIIKRGMLLPNSFIFLLCTSQLFGAGIRDESGDLEIMQQWAAP